MAGTAAMGILSQHNTTAGSGGAPAGQLGNHSIAIHVYLAATLMDSALLYYCWCGVRRRGGNLDTLSGGRWRSWKDVLSDVAIALPFWAAWEAVAYGVQRLLGPSSAKSVDSLLPKTLTEILVWIAVCITAGVCEELAFRGYLQRQFHALGGNM
jgi:membrane protease YdiL (CAAX protease family)